MGWWKPAIDIAPLFLRLRRSERVGFFISKEVI
jgi:hypothetical protein